MNNVTKKLEKLVKEREAAKALEAKRKPMAPPQMTVSFHKSPIAAAVATKTKSNLNRTISITVSVNRPKTVYPTAFAVKYEVKKEKSYADAHTPNRVRPDRRNPILQNNNEETFTSKGKSRQFSPTKITSLISEEPPAKTKAIGEFSTLNRDRCPSPVKLEAKRVNNKVRHRESEQEELRNRKKMVPHPSKNLYNPITEGSNKTWIANERKHTRPRTATQNLLADILKQADLHKPPVNPANQSVRSPKGQVFRDSSMTMACVVNESVRERDSSTGIRCGSREHRGGSMKSLVNYSFSLPFRADNISPKCNNLNGSTVLKWSEKSFM